MDATGTIAVRIGHMEFLDDRGVTEIEIAAVQDPVAAMVRMPPIDTPGFREKVDRLRRDARTFSLAANFFALPEEAQCVALVAAVEAAFPRQTSQQGTG